MCFEGGEVGGCRAAIPPVGKVDRDQRDDAQGAHGVTPSPSYSSMGDMSKMLEVLDG